MSDASTGNGKVVVNRAMSLDGFIAAPGHRMDWGGGRPLAHFVARDDFAERLKGVDLVAQTQDNRKHDIFDSDDYSQFMGGLADGPVPFHFPAPDYFGELLGPGEGA